MLSSPRPRAAGLARAVSTLDALATELDEYTLPRGGRDRAFNLTWHDWLNLASLADVSAAICAAARARTDSRGAHFREDHPETGDLARSEFTRVKMEGADLAISWKPVAFTRVRPGESLVA